jgi:hypothetical protein
VSRARVLALLGLLAVTQARAETPGAVEMSGFVQVGYTAPLGPRDCSEVTACHLMVAEERLQLRLSAHTELGAVTGSFQARVDLAHDAIFGGATVAPLELYAEASYRRATLRVGRQIVTWGTGDLLFINDIFPKDWESFFVGRPIDYLKLGVTAARLLLPHVDVVAIPVPAYDRLPQQDRFDLPGSPPLVTAPERLRLQDGELAIRAFASVGSWEGNVYAALTWLRTPVMQTADQRRLGRLVAWGASLSGPLLGGLWHLEGGHAHSADDADGDDPAIPNSAVKAFLGHTRSPWGDGTVGVQLGYERMLGEVSPDHWQATLRLTQLFLAQTLQLSLFVLYGISDDEAWCGKLAAPASRHRRPPRARRDRRGDRVAADRRALRPARPARAVADRRAQSRGRGRDGVRPRGRPRARRHARRRS